MPNCLKLFLHLSNPPYIMVTTNRQSATAREVREMKVNVEKIKHLRKTSKMTLCETGAVIGCTPSGYCKKERGQRSFSAAEIAILAGRFGVPMNDLFI